MKKIGVAEAKSVLLDHIAIVERRQNLKTRGSKGVL